jgi:hypothetical protein
MTEPADGNWHFEAHNADIPKRCLRHAAEFTHWLCTNS